MKAVLDTCILKLATFPTPENPSALIVELGLRRLIEVWVSPPILLEYAEVLADAPDFLRSVTAVAEVCYPLTLLQVIRHEPDNRFLECALAAQVDYLITVNTARGHFDRTKYQDVAVVTPGRFVNLSAAEPLIRRLLR